MLVQVSSDAAVCSIEKSVIPAIASDVPICAEPELIKWAPEITPPADVPIDPLAITLSDELKEIEVPAKRAKSPDLPREIFE